MRFYDSRIEAWDLATTSFKSTYKDMMRAGNKVETHGQVFVANDKFCATLNSFAFCTCALHANRNACMSSVIVWW